MNEGHERVKIELLVTPDCAPCAKAETLWREVSERLGLSLRVLDGREREGKHLSHRFRLKTFPALVIDGNLVAVGVQSRDEAERLLHAAVHGSGIAALAARLTRRPQDIES